MAKKKVQVRPSEHHQLVYLEASKLNPKDFTASEIAEKCVQRHGGISESYRKRCLELARVGKLRKIGKRQCRVTKIRATVYKYVEDE